MNYRAFQAQCAETYCVPSFPPNSPKGRAYFMLGALEETGEVAGVLKRVYRDQGGRPTYATYDKFVKEVGDAYWYIAMADANSSWLRHPWYRVRLALLKARLRLLVVDAINANVLGVIAGWTGWSNWWQLVWTANGVKLRDRKARGVLHGSGDAR